MELTSISPIDGRYYEKVKELNDFFSEQALMKYRVMVEIEYYIALSRLRLFKLSYSEKELKNIYKHFSIADAKKVKKIEKTTNHDVKAIEYFLKEHIKKNQEFIHFALTSEDINNLAYSLMLKDGIDGPLLENLSQLYNELIELSSDKTPMLARTHGQPASPTTLGKEFFIYAKRLDRCVDSIRKIKLTGKFNGATGNYNAHVAAYPKIDWVKFSSSFVRSLDLEPNLITYQIETHDTLDEMLHSIIRINNVIINLNQDVWTYISHEYLVQKPVKGEVGSSTMPHKVNPIDFENSEGNLGLANSILEFMARKLPITRLQRDLSDSTVIRNQGSAIAYTLIGIKSTLKGLSKIEPNYKKIKEDLNNHVEVVAEAIQTILRRENHEMPYEKLKAFTRGKKVTIKDMHSFIDKLKVNAKVKKELKSITPNNYIGKALELVK